MIKLRRGESRRKLSKIAKIENRTPMTLHRCNVGKTNSGKFESQTIVS